MASLVTTVAATTIASGALAAPPEHSNAGGKKAPSVEAHVKPIIKVGQRKFKDLNNNGKLDRYEDWRLSTEERVADLLPRMSMEEKAGMMQITSLGANADVVKDYVNNRHIRYMIIRDNPTAQDLAKRANSYQEIAEASPLGIPIVFTSNPRNHINEQNQFGISEASGQFSTWPGTLGLAATRDLELIRDFAEIAQDEWRSAGIQKNYGYQIETVTEPRWRRISGTFGEDPTLNAEIAREVTLGFQGNKLSSQSVAQTVKHFPGDGAVLNGLDPHNEQGQWAIYPTEGSLYKYHLPPFQAAIDAGTSSIMSYYNVPKNDMSAVQLPKELWYSETQQFEEVAAAYNKKIITDLLRGEMGFKGYVNSDSGVLTNRDWGVQDLTIEEKFAKAIDAGTNIFSDNNDPSGLISAINKGLVKEEELDPSVSQLLTEIFNLGLFEDPYTDPTEAQKIADSDESQARADEAHLKSVTLLRNDENMLPLTDEKIATTKLYVEVFAGNNSAIRTSSLKELIKKEDPSVTIVNTLEEANAALVMLRPSPFENPVNLDAPVDIKLGTLTGIDVDRVKEIENTVPTALVINMNNPWVIDEVEPHAAAVVATYNVKGEALLDVLRGRFNPTGKLPITIPANQEAVDKNASDVPGYAESFDYTYRNKAGDDYSFGFGLSYDK
ncbi:glycoside hydrolase family 3 protein [Metabacillus sediminilitoris]|uniref:beta-glucosidase n=2 Tax=Metabacillus sediminilitoris TaxID=2567941 RepID=A0A4S4BRV2_9BACI|nr:glycoside hydrolase family 3 protein [Metabacillus sediminilitoris]THF77720.1 glycoside hydrolase family 3 protein [Metabacillus sediminilitoris]